jgi:type I restriction enzyme S subunit
VSIPPLEEQKRIVTRIEELFSELDKAVETLKNTKEQLTVYRQAVLKEAFSSHLYEERVLGDFIEKPRYGTSKKCDSDFNIGKVPVFRIPNIDYRVGKIIHEDLKYADFSEVEKKTLSLKENDILVVRSNGSVGLVGRSALVQQKDTDGLFAGYLIRLRIADQAILYPQYLLYWLSSYEVRSYVEQVAKSTSGVNNINSSEISRIPIHICDLKAQLGIVQEIESRLSVCDSIEQTVDTALQQAEAMRQSILKQAFEGRLV